MKFLALLAFALMTAQSNAQAPAATEVSINPPPEIVADPANRLNLQLSDGGTVVIQMRPDAAPNHVNRVQTLVRQGFYDGTIFHRVVPGFMAQGGDPTGTGKGGSKLPDLKAEFNSIPHLRGTVAAARAEGKDSANSQFYIMFAPNVSLDGDYTVFGRVISGMGAVDKIAPGEPPANPTKILHAWLGNGPAPASPPAPVAAAAPPAPAAADTLAPLPAEPADAPAAEPEPAAQPE